MKKTLCKNVYRTFVTSLLIIALLVSTKSPTPVYAKNSKTTILTGLEKPGDDSIRVGIEGTYIAGQKAALDRINQIRKEACENGYPDPRNSSRALTPADYVPIKWSSALEQYARLRAAEASVYPDHGRPGSNVYIDEKNTYTTGSSEVLAWPCGSLVGGVNLWYSEKSTWINGKSGVTGHYTSMINPNNTYVGLGGFSCTEGLGSSWGGCVSGRFARTSNDKLLDSTMAAKQSNVIQAISMKQSYLSKPKLQSNSGKTLVVGDTAAFTVVRTAKFPATSIGITSAVVMDLDTYTYSSSNEKVLKVDSYGNATALKAGSATITAKSTSGTTYQIKFTVKSYIKTPTLSKITPGKKQLKVQFMTTKNTVSYASAFQIQIATNKKFSKNKKISTVKPKFQYWYPVTKYTKTVKNLKPGGKYYVRVRAYTKNNGKKYYTTWSKTKTIKIKN